MVSSSPGPEASTRTHRPTSAARASARSPAAATACRSAAVGWRARTAPESTRTSNQSPLGPPPGSVSYAAVKAATSISTSTTVRHSGHVATVARTPRGPASYRRSRAASRSPKRLVRPRRVRGVDRDRQQGREQRLALLPGAFSQARSNLSPARTDVMGYPANEGSCGSVTCGSRSKPSSSSFRLSIATALALESKSGISLYSDTQHR